MKEKRKVFFKKNLIKSTKMQATSNYIIITKPILPYKTIAEIAVKNNVEYLQLREKDISDKELLNIALQLRKITQNTNTKLVINDRPDIALLCQADLLHLGQDDIPVEKAHTIVGNMPIGLSTHNLEQVIKANELQLEYIGFGPIFTTNTKKGVIPKGIEKLKEALNISTHKIVAIGGISEKNADEIAKTKASYAAMVSYFMETKTPEKLDFKIKQMDTILQSQL